MKTGYVFMFILVVLVGGIFLKKHIGNKVPFDVRYVTMEGYEESAIGSKVYFFQNYSYDIKTIQTTDEMGLIFPKLRKDKVYFTVAVDTAIRGDLYSTVESLGKFLEYIQKDEYRTRLQIKEISELGLLRNQYIRDLDKLKEIDDKALKIAQEIDLSDCEDLKYAFNFDFLDTHNVNVKYVNLNNISDSEPNFIFLQKESETHIY